ncbi:hypothetical protein EW145_g5610 [Phellinidium pouzarii]|uniref:Nab2 type CCCH zinc finger 4 domain-containing protein n=1 Tax=Phellinidium pouzarii TaxID=167371 RepID=A0A4S4KZL7_9AGAM|nr:hypothetical protein EW145_g5610 [Phellinidium pouzarii]
MVFDITIGTERAQALQNSIQDELMKRGYSPDADPVMAEYITIMLINNKTAEQITAELEDLIGASEYGELHLSSLLWDQIRIELVVPSDSSFTDWLFEEAAKKSEVLPETPAPIAVAIPSVVASSADATRRGPPGPRAGVSPIYNHALNQALPSGSQSGQKRTASARSPSPSGQPAQDAAGGGGGRSLLERVGGRSRNGGGIARDDIQARIDAVTNQGPGPDPAMMNAFNNGMNGMMMPSSDMAAAAAAAAMNGGMVNPLMLQEVMMNQMALMAQMANNMGMMNNAGQFMGPNGFPTMNNMSPDTQNMNHQLNGNAQRRGGGPAARGRGRGGSTGAQWVAPHVAESSNAPATASIEPVSTPVPTVVAAPMPTVATADSALSTSRPGFTPPERPQSPSLCKFSLKCTNALCRYSHPSPVATPESGVVLSNDPCEAGKNCKNKDCIKAHVSPAAVGVTSVSPKPKVEPAPTSSKVQCRYGANCLRKTSGCPYSHPYTPKTSTYGHGAQISQPCRFGAGCTRATCSFQHPPGRVLPGMFHRGLAENAPVVSVPTPETGSMNVPSHNRSVVFNKPGPGPSKTNQDAEKERKEADATISTSESKTVEATA